MNKLWISIGICLAITTSMIAQTPFDCNGRIFRVVEQQGGTLLQELIPVDDPRTFSFKDLRFFNSVRINATGFRRTDGKIYGLLLGNEYTLCSIDADLRLESLRTISSLPSELLFVASDITPNDQAMVVFGYSPEEPGNFLAIIDLTSDDYPVQVLPLSTLSPLSDVKCADIAFHPTTGDLYGYDHFNRTVIRIDLENLSIAAISSTPDPLLRGNVPSIFFDAKGRLFGIGSESELLTNRSLIAFDLSINQARIVRPLAFEGNQDACSCPLGFQVLNRIDQRSFIPCTTNTACIYLSNYGRSALKVTLRDSFPPGVRIDSIVTNMSYQVATGIGTAQLQISDLSIPTGVDSIKLFLSIDEQIGEGRFPNQVQLQGRDLLAFGKDTVFYSDDPLTLAIGDPTLIERNPLDFSLGNGTIFLCPGSDVTLDPGIRGAHYRWSTGDTTASIRVTMPGTYDLTMTTDCDSLRRSIEVARSRIQVQLADTITADEGELVTLQAQIQSTSTILRYYWQADSLDLSCISCAAPTISADHPGNINLEVESLHGCISRDHTYLAILPLQVYAPNAFSPNGDGINDRFLLYSDRNYRIARLSIFDRWGNRVFDVKDKDLKDQSHGWSGTRDDYKDAMPGLYVWKATLLNAAFRPQEVSGEVYLLK